jgi:hypothetical protein
MREIPQADKSPSSCAPMTKRNFTSPPLSAPGNYSRN